MSEVLTIALIALLSPLVVFVVIIVLGAVGFVFFELLFAPMADRLTDWALRRERERDRKRWSRM